MGQGSRGVDMNTRWPPDGTEGGDAEYEPMVEISAREVIARPQIEVRLEYVIQLACASIRQGVPRDDAVDWARDRVLKLEKELRCADRDDDE